MHHAFIRGSERPPLSTTFKDRLHVTSFLAVRARRRVGHLLALPRRAVVEARHRAPERLLIAPQDIRTSDPTTAADILTGYFSFGGKIVDAQGRSPFAPQPDLDDWSRSLFGFGWLRHLRAADAALGRARARSLVAAFLASHARPSASLAWEPRVAARRTLAWLSQSPVILAGADGAFYAGFMRALEVHRAAIARGLDLELTGSDRMLAALALAEFGLCTDQAAPAQRGGTDALIAEIEAQILPDGGPINRNPQFLIDLLLDLLPLRQAYAARGLQAPPQVLNAIDRMMPMLRLFRHGDGTLALFNGMGPTAPELVATILAYDDARGRPLSNAVYAGYQRLEADGTVVVLDAGAPPPRPFSDQAHAGALSFELSSGRSRLVVNCGLPDTPRADTREAARSTAAHSTLVVGDTSSCRFAATAGLQRWLGEQIIAGPGSVQVERQDTAGAVAVSGTHDGYVQRFGLVHRRTLQLMADGNRVDGLDSLEQGQGGGSGAPYVLRFHLHPGVKARANSEGTAVRLDLGGGEAWLFEADAELFIEPSILFASPGGPRKSVQIRIPGNSATRPSVRWSFQRIAAGPA